MIMNSTADLYREIKNGNVDNEKLMSILPDVVVKDIRRDCLHTFIAPPGDHAFRPGEKLYLAEHAALYIENGDTYGLLRGVLYLTGDRIVFCSDSIDITVSYSDIIWLTTHDDLPQILEIQRSDGPLVFSVPDVFIADRCIRMIRDREYSKVIENEPLSYEDMIERADYDALLFAFRYTLGCGLPDDIRANIRDIAVNMGKLRDVLHRYPEYIDDTARFLDSHIPDTVHVISAYRVTLNSGSEDAGPDRLNDTVNDAVTALNDTLQGKISQICKETADKTLAQADALRSGIELESMKQSGIRLVF